MLIDLLFNMSEGVGYSFDKVTLKRGIYSPRAHGELEQEYNSIRKGLLDVINGRKSLSMNIERLPISEEAQKKQNKLQDSLIDYFDGNRTVKVEVLDKK